jgi:hypothetical protein
MTLRTSELRAVTVIAGALKQGHRCGNTRVGERRGGGVHPKPGLGWALVIIIAAAVHNQIARHKLVLPV